MSAPMCSSACSRTTWNGTCGDGARRRQVAAPDGQGAAAVPACPGDRPRPASGCGGVSGPVPPAGAARGGNPSGTGSTRRQYIDDGHYPELHVACGAANRPGRPPPAPGRDDPARREGLPGFQAAHAVDPERQGRLSGGARGSGLRRGGPRGLVPTHAVMWEGGDTDHAVPVVRAAPARFPNLRAASLHRGCHSPANRALLDELPVVNALPKKGCPGKGDRERGSEREFAAMRKRHPGVESRTTNLGHRGLDRVRAHGADGLPRAVSLSVVALNLHRIGPVLRKRARHRRPPTPGKTGRSGSAKGAGGAAPARKTVAHGIFHVQKVPRFHRKPPSTDAGRRDRAKTGARQRQNRRGAGGH